MINNLKPAYIGKGLVRFVINKGMDVILVYANPAKTDAEIVDTKGVAHAIKDQSFLSQDELLKLLVEAEKIANCREALERAMARK
jgi:hypothetical protein